MKYVGITEQNEAPYLEHYGIKGMKWRIRKGKKVVSSSSSHSEQKTKEQLKEQSKQKPKEQLKEQPKQKPKEQLKEQFKQKTKEQPEQKPKDNTQNGVEQIPKKSDQKTPYNHKSFKRMTDAELKDAVDRMTMENRYITNRQTLKPESFSSKFKKAAQEIAWDVSKDLAKQSLYYVVAEQINKSDSVKVNKTKYSNPVKKK